MDTIEAMQMEIDNLKKEVINLKREAGNVHARTNSKMIQLHRLIAWQRMQIEKFVSESFDQYDEELWNKIDPKS